MKSTRDELIAMATKAIDVALRFEMASINLYTWDAYTTKILVFPAEGNVDAALELSPRIKREGGFGNGEIWGRFAVDNIQVQIASIGKCDSITTVIEEPEVAATGRVVSRTVTRYICPGEKGESNG